MSAAPMTPELANDAQRGTHCVQRVVRGHLRATLYLGDCLEILPTLEGINALVTDPPYGIAYKSGMDGDLPRSIMGDEDTALRDYVVEWAEAREIPALVFGSWKVQRPPKTKARLVWEKNVGGMGDLSLPWSPMDEEIYVLGSGFSGKRESNVLRVSETIVTWNTKGRLHPHQKPAALLGILVNKCPQGTICDPFMGSGTTGIACLRTGRNFVGIEKDPAYFATAVARLEREANQGVLL